MAILACSWAIASDDSECRSSPNPIEEGNTVSLEHCSLEEISRAVATRYLVPGKDDVVIRPLDNSTRGLAGAARATLERISMTRDEQLLQLHWRLAAGSGSDRQHVKWFSIQRTGWHWVVQQAVAAGSVLMAGDVRRVYGPVQHRNRLSADTWPRGVQALVPLAPGDAIGDDSIGPVPDRYAGDDAVLQIQRGPIQIQLAGVLQEAAFIKKTAKLKLHHSGAVVYGVLQANNVVIPCDSGVLSGRNGCAE